MVLLKCDKCDMQVVWFSTETLPEKWEYYEGRELCPDCAKKFREFRLGLDKVTASKIEEYFNSRS